MNDDSLEFKERCDEHFPESRYMEKNRSINYDSKTSLMPKRITLLVLIYSTIHLIIHSFMQLSQDSNSGPDMQITLLSFFRGQPLSKHTKRLFLCVLTNHQLHWHDTILIYWLNRQLKRNNRSHFQLIYNVILFG